MSTDIDPRISPSLHPHNVQEVEGFDEETRLVLGQTETAFSTAYEGLRDVYAAREKVDRNAAMTPEARLIQLDDFAGKHLARITKTFDGELTRLTKAIEHVEGELSQPVTARASHPLASEIRAYAKSLGNKVHPFIRDAIAKGDHDTVQSVLGGPAYLSGLTPEFQKLYLTEYHSKNSPHLANRLKALRGAKELVEQRAPLVFAQMEKATGGSAMKAKKLREANSEAEKALILRDVV
jgi:hypothetical protein